MMPKSAVTRKAAAVAAFIRGEIESVEMDAGFYATSEGCSYPVAYARAIAGYIIGTLRALPCLVIEHDIEDLSTAGPDTGDIHIVCRRCGYSYYAGLY